MLHLLNTTFQEEPGGNTNTQIINMLSSIGELPIDDVCEECPFDVTNFFPNWLVDKHEADETLLVKFIQYYFNWLYCTSQSSIYMDKLLELKELENLNETTQKTFLNSYIPGFYDIVEKYENIPFQLLGGELDQERYPGFGWFYPVYLRPPNEPYHKHTILDTVSEKYNTWYMPNGNMNHAVANPSSEFSTWDPELTPILYNLDRSVELVKNIKLDLYQRKTTTKCVNNFFKTIFGYQTAIDMQEQLAEVSPVVTGVNPLHRQYMEELYGEFLEPVGIQTNAFILNSSSLILESNEREYAEQRRAAQDPEAEITTAFEMTTIGNYDVYHLNDVSTLPPQVGCNDGTPGHPRGITLAESNVPAYTHPNWSIGISGGTSFGNINIFDFILLPFTNNPNYGITSCTFL